MKSQLSWASRQFWKVRSKLTSALGVEDRDGRSLSGMDNPYKVKVEPKAHDDTIGESQKSFLYESQLAGLTSSPVVAN